jgi:hypothetical protein
MVSSPCLFQFFSAGRAFCVFIKLHDPAPGIGAYNHQVCAALLTRILHKGLLFAGRARNGKGAAASGASAFFLFYFTQARGAMVAKRILAAAKRAESGIPLDECAALHTILFISSHFIPLLFLCAARRRYTSSNPHCNGHRIPSNGIDGSG